MAEQFLQRTQPTSHRRFRIRNIKQVVNSNLRKIPRLQR